MRTPTIDNPLKILALGAGVQSSFLLLGSIAGLLPRLDAWVFADTRYEPKAVYKHLDWLESLSAKAGIVGIRCSVGDLRQDALDFRQDRVSRDGKRWASVPFFVTTKNGKRGQIRRQCTSSYKIEPMERVIREQFLGLKRGQRSKPIPLIEQWIGISSDEESRCSHPGLWRKVKTLGEDLFGEKFVEKEEAKWHPIRWKYHAYPLCRARFNSDRTVDELNYLPRPFERWDCIGWLSENYPGREIPRSACIACPYRSNEEWRRMKAKDPESWADAVQFDHDIRRRDLAGQINRKVLIGLPYVHDSLIPLDMVDLSVDDGKTGAGCGIQRAIQGQFAGMCGV